MQSRPVTNPSKVPIVTTVKTNVAMKLSVNIGRLDGMNRRWHPNLEHIVVVITAGTVRKNENLAVAPCDRLNSRLLTTAELECEAFGTTVRYRVKLIPNVLR